MDFRNPEKNPSKPILSRRKGGRLTTAVLFLTGYLAGLVASLFQAYLVSGSLLIVTALLCAGQIYLEKRDLLDMETLFSLFWIGGIGISALKLSRLATVWTAASWFSFAAFYLTFLAGYELLDGWVRKHGRKPFKGSRPAQEKAPKDLRPALAFLITGTTAVSVVCFIYEAVRLQLVPLFSKLPHAYSSFHISGVHYFTVSCVLVPALAVIYFFLQKQEEAAALQRQKEQELKDGLPQESAALADEAEKAAGEDPAGGKPEKKGLFARLRRLAAKDRRNTTVFVCTVLSLAVPILAVSRFQLIFAIALALVVWLSMTKRLSLKMILLLILIMVPLYVGLTVARNHDVTYLNGIFEMKNEDTPIFITQPYMYIANNYDNFNCLTKELPEHTNGLRMAYPFIVFLGMKFTHPELVSFPIYTTKTELTTLTIIYDAYYDFGIFGVCAFGLLLGLFCCLVSHLTHTIKDPIGHLFYAQALMYLVFSFFTTWYSNPATWFYYGVTVIYLLVGLLWPRFPAKRKGIDLQKKDGND